MNDKLAVAICLTADRLAMTARAVRSFLDQTYSNKRLYILDSGVVPATEFSSSLYDDPRIVYEWMSPSIARQKTIGALRNYANMVNPEADIFVHWDSDDCSHPLRIVDQVKQLQQEKTWMHKVLTPPVVGYNDLMFWREPISGGSQEHSETCDCGTCGPGKRTVIFTELRAGEAYYYIARGAFAPGTSLAYWRSTWEAKHFPDLPTMQNRDGEDYMWLQNLPLSARSCMRGEDPTLFPLLIASLHEGNTFKDNYEKIMNDKEASAHYFRRANNFDDECRGRMAL